MGYTHYWRINTDSIHKEPDYQLAIRQCQRIVRAWNKAVKAIDPQSPERLAGYSAHTKIAQYKGLRFNGTRENGHEDFFLGESLHDNESFNFCKTAQKPYDTVVTACLITLKHYLGGIISVSSDGRIDDWQAGLKLARSVLRIKSLEISLKQ